VVVLATLGVVLCLGLALRRIRVESDLTVSIPAGSPVLETGRRLLRKHPVVDRIAIDLSLRDGSAAPDRLVEAAELAQKELSRSGLFDSVGTADWAAGLAALHGSVAERLPTLFSAQDLRQLVDPRLGDVRIQRSIEEDYAELSELEGVGQARVMAADPLRLRELVYTRLGALVPKADVRIEQNHLLSVDGRHLLVTAEPHRTVGDPESSRRLANLLGEVGRELDQTAAREGKPAVTLTATGAYRAAMDNEQIVKSDTNRAVWLVSIAVSLLLLLCFSRPVLGLLTLLPATAGVAVALLVYSLFSRSMSALALGFGGALISITVDQGIVYVAYLDRVRGSSGKQAAEQTFSSVSLAVLTQAGAFFALAFSGYRLLAELGIFAALGSAFSFVFVHTVFPLVFRTAPPSQRRPILPVDDWLRRVASGRVWVSVALAALLLIALGPFARPRFEVELERMNTVTAETRAAEERVKGVWGDLFSRVYVLLEAPSVAELEPKADDLARLLADERSTQRLSTGFSPSLVWPGPNLAAENLAAWQEFWTPDRQTRVLGALARTAREAGFAEDAFEPFTRAVRSPSLTRAPIPPEAYSLLGIARARDGQGWVWLGAVERGSAYDAGEFSRHAGGRGFTVFDGQDFGRHLNVFLRHAFLRMLLIVAPFVLVAVVASFISPRLVALVLGPVALGLVATLGTIGLLGQPIDIPGLMLGVVVLGMGTNFSVYLVRAHQRFPDVAHPVHDSVRVAALLDGGATVLGMGVMLTAEHAAARSAGLVGVLGIGFSLGAALVLLPPVLRALVPIDRPWPEALGGDPRRLVWSRFRFLEPRPLISAWRALRFDRSLPGLGDAVGSARSVLVLGSGWGVEAAWLLACLANRIVVGLEADPERVRSANVVLRERGRAIEAKLPDLSPLDEVADAAVLLDPVFALSEPELARLIDDLATRLAPLARVVYGGTRSSELDVLLERSGFSPAPRHGPWLVAERAGAPEQGGS
jgi:predicted RND superfamily exporter protein